MWETNFLKEQGQLVYEELGAAIHAATAQIGIYGRFGSSALREKFIEGVFAQTEGSGLASPSNWLLIRDALKM